MIPPEEHPHEPTGREQGRPDPFPLSPEPAATRRSAILVVDDDPANVKLLAVSLGREGYDVRQAFSATEALESVASAPPDVILLDAIMPDLTGFEVCSHLKSQSETRLIPIVMITGLTAPEDRLRGIEVGADDFLTKPVNHLELHTRVRSLLRAKRYADELEGVEGIVTALSRAIEARDGYTEQHTERVARRAVALGEQLGLTPEILRVLHLGAILHDVGKIGIPEAILNKPSRLTAEEFAVIRQHPDIGVRICSPLRSRAVAEALPIIMWHHERIDGQGYPNGLTDDEIPLLARITAIADGYDAMISDRPYRRGMAPERALSILHEEAGEQWDRTLVDAFEQLPPALLASA